MGDRFERTGAMASEIPKSVRWSYNANFKLMAIKRGRNQLRHGTEIRCRETECTTLEKTRTIKRSKFNPKSILWAQAWEFQCR
jgi:hypothetical protein